MVRIATTCKTCRRLGVSVCGRAKCALTRKPYPPGIHGKKFRRAGSEFGQQLREKQRVRILYNIRERQFENYVQKALSQKASGAPEALLNALEERLDNVAFRLGFFATRPASRQGIVHRHILVNGKMVTIPSYRIKVGDEISISPRSLSKPIFGNLDLTLKKQVPPSWLSLDRDSKKGSVIAHPGRDALNEFGRGLNISAIIEYYSR